ncbi:HNH endonuclease [Streptomyces longwoodensis]|uniref:HNH endonuclease n=1 Tax=Streptomyces longwoodensis TaxID=68231 RepID=UPI0022513A11|nr:HNH endonuclease signature motif containing protein [Streptomyces longwoodensis]MCX4993840.1 HNH endonuclease [Streptomyces longwoodensis]MCX4998040.1 HNH endonuclease [Streptomyces longwoodensis]
MPYAPPSRCTDPECHEFATTRGRCDDHQPIPWEGRDDKAARYGITSGEWRTLKRRVTQRDNGCCYMCGAPPPDPYAYDEDDRATWPHELDHIVPVSEGGARRSLDNLGLACTTCHDEKSKLESTRANQRRRSRLSGR